MRRILAAAATTAALALALPASAAVLFFGAGAHVETYIASYEVSDGAGVSGAIPLDNGGTNFEHGYEWVHSPIYGPDGDLVGEAGGSGFVTIDFSSDGSAFTGTAKGLSSLTNYTPAHVAYFDFVYVMDVSFQTDSAARLNLSYENADFVRVFANGALVFDHDLRGKTGATDFTLAAGDNYELYFSGNADTDHVAYLEGVGSVTGDDTSVYRFTVGNVPEPATWALMVAGFGGVGAAMRRRPVRA
jgi:hypothetical protein